MIGISRQGGMSLKAALRCARLCRHMVALPAALHRCLSQATVSSTRSNAPKMFLCNEQKFLLKQIRQYSDNLPKHVKVALPALSPTMELGTIVSWQKKEGDQLGEGDLLCEIETDKATMGFETPEEGYLAKIIIPEGTKDIPIGKLLCIIVESQDDVGAFKSYTPGKETDSTTVAAADVDQPAPPPPAAAGVTPTPPPVAAAPAVGASTDDLSSRIKASPYAKKVAAEAGVDLSQVTGSGPGGRILLQDVTAGPAGTPISAASENAFGVSGAVVDYEDIPLSNMRRTISKRLSQSKSTIPHYYLTSEIIIDDLLSIRYKLNGILAKQAEKEKSKPVKISVNDFIIKASALSCLRVPEANSFFMDTFIRQNNNVDVSVAVSTDVGLITPIVFNAHQKGLATISTEVASLAVRAREGKLQPNEFQGGTFTVSNLGMFGSVDHFTAIINPPQSCILAIGSAKKKLVPVGEDFSEHRAVTALKVTLSCDHRVVDGAVGAVWLRHFKGFLEQPQTMLL